MFDAEKSATSGYLINNLDNQNISYFAVDTVKLSDKRIVDLAVAIFLTNSEKNNDLSSQIPNLINIEPDGPNDSRDDMSLTYQSIIESIMSSFRIAISMKNFDVPLKNDILEKYKLDLDQITSQELFEKINLTITHHNNYELGPDRFNEGKNILKDKILPIFESVKNSENKIDASKKKFKELFDKEKIRKQKNWIPILKYHDDWLYEEMLELINLNEQILSNSTQNEQFDFLQNYLEKILGKSFPKINEMTEYKIIDSSDQKK